MIKFEELKPMLEETGYPVIEYADMVDDDEYEYPLIIYNYSDDEPFSADGIPYITLHNIRVVVLTEEKSLQENVKQILLDHEIHFSYDTDYDDDNRVFLGTYNFQAL